MNGLLRMLEGGDRRSIGRVAEVVAVVRASPSRFGELFEGMLVDDEVVCMRAADAAEKVTAEIPELLEPFKKRLLSEVAMSEQQEVRWHVAQMIPRLSLTRRERGRAERLLIAYLDDDSNIVKVCSMQALADLAEHDDRLAERIVPIFERMRKRGSAAVKSRGRKLLPRLMQRVHPSPRPGLRRPRQPMPAFVREALVERGLWDAYRARPPYQQNDYLGWIHGAKRDETKAKRLAQMLDELERGDRYMKMLWRGPRRTP